MGQIKVEKNVSGIEGLYILWKRIINAIWKKQD